MSSPRTWSITQVARLSGVTSRALRHYEALGLLKTVRAGDGQYRLYDEHGVLRLMRILLLRDMGIPLSEIGRLLDAQEPDLPAALRQHMDELMLERARIERRLSAVRWTLDQLSKGEPLMAENMLDGFDQHQYRKEVEQRWGPDAWNRSHQWWSTLTPTDAQRIRAQWAEIGRGYAAAKAAGLTPDHHVAQEAARRHVELLAAIPATQKDPEGQPERGYLLGLADLYANDSRYVTFTGSSDPDIGTYLQEAMRHYLGAADGTAVQAVHLPE
ncbi:MerR family transcriptional regulator [Caldimonas brevitalea]|uniref:Transcriptional regulator, MerR family n=1 Tax=Caldimonas brevitalea TaxID=413882 RepID=A0A0G3BIK6_9BURK|nr:TipAS antibiotic-recognition domain-containing protein [Caldimonas brevitalea]AKJ29217.1 transcriptional regulator, MerR family [Caldimonas brevitalea]